MATHDPANASGRTPVLIVDDHKAVRCALSDMLGEDPDLTVVAAVESAEDALTVVQDQPVDLAIVDISLGQMNGLELTQHLHQQYPAMRILILSMHDPALYADKAMELGASGYVAKQNASEVLIKAVHEVLDGHTYF